MAAADSVMGVSSSSQQVHENQVFDVYIDIEPETPVAGAQLDLLFDSGMLTVNNIEAGDFFEHEGVMSIFIGGTVDNTQGRVRGLFAVTLGQAEISTSGDLAHITFKANGPGMATINISNVILSDASGCAVPVTIRNARISILERTNTSQTEITTGSGGGGGGGSGDTGEKTENIELKEAEKLYVISGNEVTYQFDEDVNPVRTISYMSLKNSGFITSTIEILKGVSSTVPEKPEGMIYRNMNIWVGKAGYATGSNMEDMRISFAVLKKWVHVNGIETDDIHLKRFHDKKWHTLHTVITGENEDFFFFEAETPGFSPFAITADVTSGIVPENMKDASSSKSEIGKENTTQNTEITGADDKDSLSEETHINKLGQNGFLLLLCSFSIIILCRSRNLP